MNHETTEPFNQEPDDFSDAAIERARRALDETPETIGPYRIIERLGAGGMGEVYRADQKEPIRRQVAIKLIKLGMDTRQVVARFEAERQALAMMDHPNIAKVFDAGTTDDGRPYFVMEYVKGVPLTDYCDTARLPLRERLKLFIPVCQAVQHAHQKGIVHRDLKPSNILICLYDGRPVPKVIDFGLAKALYQPLTEQTIYTKHGMMVGTPLYMSPEQAEQNNLDIDTRTDIYSLGVVLYELLTGSTPLELEQLRVAAYNEVLRLIKEVEPPKPSARLSSNATLPSVAAQRGVEPKQLSRAVSGDLDWIVMKALDKERSRRYETASGFARDVERFLNDEAVEACPPSRSYRLKRFVYKHKGQVLAASAVLCALVFGLAATSWQWLLARQAEQAAVASEKQAIASEQKAIEARDQATRERDAKNEALVAEAAQRELADKQRDIAERQFIEGLLRPIGYDGGEPGSAEIRSFVDWSAIPDSRLQVRVLEIAFESPEMAMRLAIQEQRVIQASVGLSPTRRAKAIELMSAKQRDMQADPRIRVAAAWLALELGSTDMPAFTEALKWLSNLDSANAEPRWEFSLFVDLITFRLTSLSLEQIAECGNTLIEVINKSPNSYGADPAVDALVALAPKLSAEQASRGFEAVISAVKSERLQYAHLEEAVQALAPSVGHEEITRGSDVLITALEKSNDSSGLRLTKECLAVLTDLAPSLSPEQVTRLGDAIIAALEKRDSFRESWQILIALAPKLSPMQINRAWKTLIAVHEKSTDGVLTYGARDSLVALAPNLDVMQLTLALDTLIAVLERPTDAKFTDGAAKILAALASYLSPEQLTRAWDAMIAMVERSGHSPFEGADYSPYGKPENNLATLVSKLTPEQVTRGWDALVVALETHPNAHPNGHVLAALAPKLGPEQIAQGWAALSAVLEKSPNRSRVASVEALVALAPKLSPDQIVRGWDSLIDAQEKSAINSGQAVEVLVALAVLSPNLTPKQAMSGWDQLVAIVKANNNKDVFERSTVKDCLVTIAPTLSLTQTASAAESLVAIILEKSSKREALVAAFRGLVALAPHLRSDETDRIAELITDSLHRVAPGELSDQILSLMPHLDFQKQDRISTATLATFLDDLVLPDFRNYNFDSKRSPVFRLMVNGRALAELLKHPAVNCETDEHTLTRSGDGEPREPMLQRFEELVLHNGRRVFLPLSVPKEGEAESEQHSLASKPPPRRFHTIHDAAAWIQQNWPDFDLDAPYRVTWREWVRE